MAARNAKSSGRKAASADTGEALTGHEIGARIGWLFALAAWLFVAASLVSFNIADPPSPAVAAAVTEVAHWCGPGGAHIAYYGFSTLGVGLWLLVAGVGLGLGLLVAGRRVSQPLFRLIGLVLLAAAVSGMHALFFPRATVFPEGAGGLAAIVGVDRLQQSFSVLGSCIWIGLVGVIGAIVAFDRWLIAGPVALWNFVAPGLAFAASGAAKGAGAAASAGAAAWQRRAEEIRENDLDDDERVETPPAKREKPARPAKERKRVRPEKPVVVELDEGEEYEEGEYETEDEAALEPALAIADSASAEATRRALEADDEEDGPGAPQVFDAEQLREKIARLPVRFAQANKEVATEDDMRGIQGVELEGYKFPTLELLEDPEESYSERMEAFVREQARGLEEALRVYKIQGEVVGIDSGPVITLFEVRLAPGTKVSQLSAVSSDIARALKAINIRIVPNMVGRDTVGIEVPNAQKEKVRLKELMSAKAGELDKMRLPMFLGKDASGEPLVEDLAAMPHLLIAGTTGSGKSVCMNTVIMSFLYTRKPSELKLVLIDPKMVELSMFRDIPHLMCPVVTEMGKAAAILEWAVQKMDERYELLAEAGVRDIGGYNDLEWEELKERMAPANESEEARIPRKLPYVVFMIDELADLMMTHKEVEGSIVRIAQKARAVGIHLILATQRPQANVVTGLIKSNMPGRICFKVASGMDSRIVMDQKGGELLLGQGDMLFLSPRSHKVVRAQGTLVEDREARRVVRFLKEIAAPSFERQLVQLRGDGTEEPAHDGLANAQEDPLFDKAVEIVLETKRGSVSLLQRRLAIGYTRASRLIDLMGEAGIIGAYKGTVAREVAITPEEWEAMKAQAARDAEESGEAPAGEQGNLFPEEEAAVATLDDEDDEADAPAPRAGASVAIEAAPFEPTGALDDDDEEYEEEDEDGEEYEDEEYDEEEEDEDLEEDEEDDESEEDEDGEDEEDDDEEEWDEEEDDEDLEE
ncbi:MAG: DNA translocase FtsK 4TM domain-containing protein, partial [Phycisphaerales bacterium]